ncbi:helix-turn-helix domain-containing protein [Streptomyces sp. NPDC048270]|uniref:helix-turn-helix domain-containing protein n=1 Tax=Streptomyces sp. NPDC048270 TaxID=3154615 RepID=UPI0033C8A650
MTQRVEGLPAPKERRRLRAAAELTPDQVAKAVGVTPSTVRSWESGRTHPRGRKRELYADFLARLATPPDAPQAPATPATPEAAAEPSTPVTAGTTAGRAAGTTGATPGATSDAPPNATPDGTPDATPTADAGPPEPTPRAIPTASGESPAVAASGTAAPAEPTGPPTPTEPTGTPAPAEPTATPAPDGSTAAAEPGESTGTAEPEAEPQAETEAEPEAEPPAVAPPRRPAEAFDALYAHAAPDLARQTYLLTSRRRLALESVERAFRQAWAQWPEVATDPDPVGWVRAAAYEYALSPWHRFRRAHRHPDKPPAEPVDRILLDAMLALPTVHRRTVLLYDGVGLDLPDTAAETEASTPATGNRLLNAHADLADRIPELAGVPPEKQSALLRDLFDALRPAVELEPRPAPAVRGHGERRTRQWTRATLSLTAVIAAATAYTAATAPTRYEPPRAPGESVSGVPPLSGPPQLTEQSRLLHDKLRADPAAGPARIAPRID